jgi:RHS repeat-associated protein
VHHDGLGSVRALTDETGTTIDTRGYEAFGTKNVEAGSDPLTYGFAGEPFQADSMLAYHRARWMDARVGRFDGMDPLDHPGLNQATAHLYAYASDNPVNATDPSGQDDLNSVSITIAVISVLALSADTNPGLGLNLTAGAGQIYANLRAREAGGIIFSHLYIEYVDKGNGTRVVFQALPQTGRGSTRASGNLVGSEKPWGADLEQDSDDASPLIGVTVGTHACLENNLTAYNEHPVSYDSQGRGESYGHNSNWWAINMCNACGLTFLQEPGLIDVDDSVDPTFSR